MLLIPTFSFFYNIQVVEVDSRNLFLRKFQNFTTVRETVVFM